MTLSKMFASCSICVASTFIAAAALLAPAHGQTAGAPPTDNFYRDKTVTIIVSTGPGGGYDLYARTLSEHIGRHVPGQPNFILQFMPGAGGVRAADYLYNIAAKDGSVIGLMSNGIPIVQLLKGDVRFDVAKFNFIGRADAMNAMTMVAGNLNVKTVDAARGVDLVFGSTGRGQQSDMHPNALKNVLGLSRIKVVIGYKGSSEVNLALEKGEVNAHSSAWSSWKTSGARMIQAGTVVPLVEHGVVKSPDNPGVPLVLDLARNSFERQVLTLISSDAAVGRAFIMPPGVPASRVALLREAFEKTIKDPAFLAEASKRKLEIWPLTGAELQSQVETVMKSSPDVIATAKNALGF
jgi:tripartite-type tricarboxylate transporter receptor subunit TctC